MAVRGEILGLAARLIEYKRGRKNARVLAEVRSQLQTAG
jgi:hypothetical protein